MEHRVDNRGLRTGGREQGKRTGEENRGYGTEAEERRVNNRKKRTQEERMISSPCQNYMLKSPHLEKDGIDDITLNTGGGVTG